MGDGMAQKPPLDVGEMQSLNFKAVRNWIEANKASIKAKPNETVLYSGVVYDTDIAQAMSKEDQEAFKGTPVWKSIEKHRAAHQKMNLPFEYQTLPDVLRSIRDYPTIVDRDRQPKNFRDANDCFQALASLGELLPDPKGLSKKSWSRLSEVFASNAEGDIRMLDGYADDFGRLQRDKDFIDKELGSLLKNDKLSPAGKKLLLSKMSKYGSEFDRRHTEAIKRLDRERSQLKSPKG